MTMTGVKRSGVPGSSGSRHAVTCPSLSRQAASGRGHEALRKEIRVVLAVRRSVRPAETVGRTEKKGHKEEEGEPWVSGDRLDQGRVQQSRIDPRLGTTLETTMMTKRWFLIRQFQDEHSRLRELKNGNWKLHNLDKIPLIPIKPAKF
jgi:hypothetical protein